MKHRVYVQKHENIKEETIQKTLFLPVLGMVLCLICFIGTTWAWLSKDVQTPEQNLKMASYEIAVSVDGQPVNDPISLKENTAYEICLEAKGTAKRGYCIVANGTDSLYTDLLPAGTKISFTLIPETTAEYTFTAQWGIGSEQAEITDGCQIGQKLPETQKGEAEGQGEIEPPKLPETQEGETEGQGEAEPPKLPETQEGETEGQGEAEAPKLPETQEGETEGQVETEPPKLPETQVDETVEQGETENSEI